MDQTESARNVVLRWINEVWNRGRIDLVPELVHNPYIRHEPDGSTHTFSIEQSAERVSRAQATITDVFIDLRRIVAEGDCVSTHFVVRGTDLKSGEKLLQTGMEIFRIADGKIAEVWTTAGFDGEW